MTTKEKKEYGALVILLLVTFVVIYMNFFKTKSLPTGGLVISVPGNTLPDSGNSSAVSSRTGAFLPEGTTLDFKVLQDKRFKDLTLPYYPSVTKDEIGSDNLFGQ